VRFIIAALVYQAGYSPVRMPWHGAYLTLGASVVQKIGIEQNMAQDPY
jgi:hypothetical protein